MRRSGSRRNEPEPDQHPEDPQLEAPRRPSDGPVEPIEVAENGATNEEAETATPAPETPAEKMQGRLVELQEKLREHLDYDQIAEVRLALSSRVGDLDKHVKKASELGVREEDARRRLRLIHGSDTRFGLLRIFAPEETTEQTDVFFDPAKPNGRPGDTEDQVISFTTVDGQNIESPVDDLEEYLPELRQLHEAGTLPEHVRNEIMAQDFWHLIVGEGWDQGAPAGSKEGADRLATAAGVRA